MSLKNAEDLSEFGARLRDLIVEKGKTPKTLAKDLLEEGLVKVKFGGKDITKKADNAIGAVEKKIRTHINAKGPSHLQGEFVLAYCKYFNISSDYLFGLTPLRTNNMDIRNICQITGLSEKAVNRLVYHGGDPRDHNNNCICWSRLIESEVYESINRTITSTQDQLMAKAKAQAYAVALRDAMKSQGGKKLLDMQADLKGYEEQLNICNNALSGSLFIISRDVSNVIERFYITPANNLKEVYKGTAEKEVKALYG